MHWPILPRTGFETRNELSFAQVGITHSMCGLCPGGWARPTMRATRAAKARITALPATFTTSKITAKRTRGRSQHRHPAVHGEGLTDDVARPRTAQPQHGRGDLLGPA